MLSHLKSGAFIDPARVRRIALALIAFYAVAMAALFATSPDGLRDYQGRPLGSDFMAIWTGGVLAAEGDGIDAYDPGKNFAALQRAMDDETPPNLPFLHPPQFLLAAAPFGALPYLPAWLLFAAFSAAAYLAAAAKCAPKGPAMLVAVAAPAFFLNIANGQAGLLIAASFAFAAVSLKRRPLLAGLFFGLVAIKPQYGVLIPIALAAGGCWRAFAGAAASVLAQAAIATIAFGGDVWSAFLGKLSYANDLILVGGGLEWEKFISLYGGLRGLGASHDAALGGHVTFAVIIAASLVLLWRSGADLRVKLAALISGALLASPYALDYDAALLLPAIALMASLGIERGFAPFEKSVLALAYLAPIVGFQITQLTFVPLSFLSGALLFAAILRRSGSLRFGFPLASAAV